VSVTADHVNAIVVTYNPERVKLAALLTVIVPQVNRVIIVDNGSAADRDWLRALAQANRCDLIALDENVGVATGHNLGIESARSAKADAVLLLDQDSLPAPDMVQQLRRALAELTAEGALIGAVGPRHVDERTGVQSPFVRFGYFGNAHVVCDSGEPSSRIRCDHLITSGSLIPMTSLNEIGAMDDRLFIDTVDTEWCFRALAKGYALFGVCAASMAHSVGNRLATLRVPQDHDVVIHSPLRLYYMIRNHLLLYRRPYAPVKWKSQDLPRLLFKAAVFAAVIPPRFSNMAMIWKGARDAVRGKTGRYAL